MNKLLEPVALMSVALAGVLVFGIGHLVTDIVAWDGDALEQFGGIATDSHTVLTGMVLIAGFVAVVNRPEPAPFASWPTEALTDRWRSDPRGQMETLLTAFFAVGVLKTALAFVDSIADDFDGAVRVVLHDTVFLFAIGGFGLTLTAVASARIGREWAGASRARDVVSIALIMTPLLGGLLAVMWFVELWEFTGTGAVEVALYVLLEVVVAFSMLVVADSIVRALHPPTDDTGVALPDAYAGVVRDPVGLLDKALPAVILLGVGHTFFGVLFHADFGAEDVIAHLGDGALHTALGVGLVMAARVAAATSFESLLEPSTGPNDYAEPLRLATLVALAAGLVASLFLFLAWREIETAKGLYFLFNRLTRASIIVGVLAGLGALHRPSEVTAG